MTVLINMLHCLWTIEIFCKRSQWLKNEQLGNVSKTRSLPFFMGVGEYAVIKEKWRNIPVEYYVEKNMNLTQSKFLDIHQVIDFSLNN